MKTEEVLQQTKAWLDGSLSRERVTELALNGLMIEESLVQELEKYARAWQLVHEQEHTAESKEKALREADRIVRG
jgi:hypothetical protein